MEGGGIEGWRKKEGKIKMNSQEDQANILFKMTMKASLARKLIDAVYNSTCSSVWSKLFIHFTLFHTLSLIPILWVFIRINVKIRDVIRYFITWQ